MISLFVDDARFIGFFAAIITIFVLAIITIIFRNKIPFVKKYYTQTRMNALMFCVACIVGLTIAGINNFEIFDEDSTDRNWIKNILYLLSGSNGFILTAMFGWFACMLPFKYFTNICVFLSYKEPLKKFIKLTLLYVLFAVIAIGISSMQYGLDSFFQFDSEFSNARQPVNFDKHPAYYVVGRAFFTYVMRNWLSTVVIMSTIVFVCIIEFFIIKHMRRTNYAKLIRIVEKVDKLSEWSRFMNYTTPVLIFVSLTLSLSVHTIATTIHLSLLFMLLIILTVVIFGLNIGFSVWTKMIGRGEYWNLVKLAIHEAWHSHEIISCFENIKKRHVCEHLNLIGNEQNTYNIFATIIYSIVITSFLGFASGPLHTDDWSKHIYFWLSLFFIGYLLMFAYTFKYSSIVSCKMMMAMGTAYTITTFNTGILNFFNPVINKLATFSSIMTLYSIALKHAKYDLK